MPQEPKVAEAQPKPLPPQKPKPPKKQDPPKKDKPKDETAEDDTASFLQNVENKLKKNQAAAQKQQKTAASPAAQQEANLPQQDYNGPPLSEGEKDMIKEQIENNALVDPGMPGLQDAIVEVKVVVNPDGTVQSANYDPNKSNGQPNWTIFAESCRRAVFKSSPLRMPPEKPYEAWKEMTLVFHWNEMARM